MSDNLRMCRLLKIACVYIILFFPGQANCVETDLHFILNAISSSFDTALASFPSTSIKKVSLESTDNVPLRSQIEECLSHILTSQGIIVIRKVKRNEYSGYTLAYFVNPIYLFVFPASEKNIFRRHIQNVYSLYLIENNSKQIIWTKTGTVDYEDRLPKQFVDRMNDISSNETNVRRYFFKRKSYTKETVTALIFMLFLAITAF